MNKYLYHRLDNQTPRQQPINGLDAAYSAIPEAERRTRAERDDRVLAAAGMPGWLRITPTVKGTNGEDKGSSLRVAGD